ncbi:MAG: hypothetical protein L0241_09995 [Planctomycetia bacterium]|nr:hypothetical protein [Planctomycetia bacterium]
MTGKQIGGVVCLVLAVVFTIGAIISLSKGDGPGLGDRSGLGVSRVVGACLPALGALILGLWLFKKPEPSKRTNHRQERTPPQRRRGR